MEYWVSIAWLYKCCNVEPKCIVRDQIHLKVRVLTLERVLHLKSQWTGTLGTQTGKNGVFHKHAAAVLYL